MSQEKVILEWSTQTGEEKWHIALLRKSSDGKLSQVTDSMKKEFPINPDNFGPFDEDSLIMKLKEVFPGAEIILKWP